MSETERYIFSGHAIGAAAQFYRLYKTKNLNHVIPVQGASALPTTGGLSKSEVSNYYFAVDQPRKLKLISVRRITTLAEGKERGDRYETEVDAEIDSIEIVDKLRIGLVKAHMFSTFKKGDQSLSVSTKGNKIQGMYLGEVEARITLDEEPLCAGPTQQRLAEFYRKQSGKYRLKNSWRFNTAPDAAEIAERYGQYRYSLVKEIKLVGPEKEKEKITVAGYTIKWEGFGRIVLAEVLVKGNERRLSMVRLAMGSDAEGDSTIGEGQSNGQVGS